MFYAYGMPLREKIRFEGPVLQFHACNTRKNQIVQTAAKFAMLLEDSNPEIPLSAVLLAAKSNVLCQAYHVYALFLNEAMINNQETLHVFTKVLDPFWNPEWKRRWLATVPEPGETVWDYFERFRTILAQTVTVNAEFLELRHVKEIFVDRLHLVFGNAKQRATLSEPYAYDTRIFQHIRAHGPYYQRRPRDARGQVVARTATEFVDRMSRLMPDVPLAALLLAARCNVSNELYATYAVFLAERMVDDAETRRVFLQAVDPNWNREWKRRWRTTVPEPGETVPAFYARFCDVLRDVVVVTPNFTAQRHIKDLLAGKLFAALGPAAAPLNIQTPPPNPPSHLSGTTPTAGQLPILVLTLKNPLPPHQRYAYNMRLRDQLAGYGPLYLVQSNRQHRRGFIARSVDEFATLLKQCHPSVPLSALLIAANPNVPRDVYYTYAVFMRETMINDQATRDKLVHVLDPFWNLEWKRRWLRMAPRPGETVWDFYRRFFCVLDEVVMVDDMFKSQRHIKRILADRLLPFFETSAAQLAALVRHWDVTLESMANALRDVVIPDLPTG
ncbi:hypothetical protein H9P43_006859 [Blastocladiella emersonii ATCC 22665]|nr:hypothetical protein H9P43_006859 [Blastocladiella emersonii ATCC 22665]